MRACKLAAALARPADRLRSRRRCGPRSATATKLSCHLAAMQADRTREAEVPSPSPSAADPAGWVPRSAGRAATTVATRLRSARCRRTTAGLRERLAEEYAELLPSRRMRSLLRAAAGSIAPDRCSLAAEAKADPRDTRAAAPRDSAALLIPPPCFRLLPAPCPNRCSI